MLRPPQSALVDTKTGLITPEWLNFFADLPEHGAATITPPAAGGVPTTPTVPTQPVAPTSIITITGPDIGPGTPGHLTKWLQPTTLGDSIITETGTAVSVAGTLSAFTVTGIFVGDGAGLSQLNASALATGLVPDARLASNVLKVTGGFPGGTTAYLRADGTFAVPPAGGGGTGDEVSIGPDDPGAAYELWYDTDEVYTAGILPSLHASTHAAAGADPVTVTTLAGYPGGTTTYLRADGTFAVPAGSGGGGTGDVVGPGSATNNAIALFSGTTGKVLKDSTVLMSSVVLTTDSRLSDARTPTAHATSHNTGGSDPLTALSAAVLTTGTLLDARLSVNVLKFTGGYPGDTTTYLRADGTFGIPAGGDEVFVGTADPGATYEVWFDTDEVITDTGTMYGPASAVAMNLPAFADGAGKTLLDSGIPMTSVAKGAASSVANNLSAFADTTGKLLVDSGIALSNVAKLNVANTFSGIVTATAGLGTTPLNATNLTSGTVPDARLSANVPLLNVANVFTQQIQTIAAPNAQWRFSDTAQPTDLKCFRVMDQGQVLVVQALNDAFTAITSTPLILNRAGDASVGRDVYEKGRTTPVGHWIDVAYVASNFVGAGGMTWTVEAGDQVEYAYTVIGKTMIIQVNLNTTTTSGTASTNLILAIPGGATARYAGAIGSIRIYDTATGDTIGTVITGSVGINYLTIYRGGLGNWPLVTNGVYVQGTVILPIQ